MRAFLLFDRVPFVRCGSVGKSGFLSFRQLGLSRGRRCRSSHWPSPFLCSLVGLALVTLVCFFLSHEPSTYSFSKYEGARHHQKDGGLPCKKRGEEGIIVEVEEWETCLCGPSDVAGIIAALAKNACDGGGYRRFVLIKTSEGDVVAAAVRDAALQENQDNGKRLQCAEIPHVAKKRHQDCIEHKHDDKTLQIEVKKRTCSAQGSLGSGSGLPSLPLPPPPFSLHTPPKKALPPKTSPPKDTPSHPSPSPRSFLPPSCSLIYIT